MKSQQNLQETQSEVLQAQSRALDTDGSTNTANIAPKRSRTVGNTCKGTNMALSADANINTANIAGRTATAAVARAAVTRAAKAETKAAATA